MGRSVDECQSVNQRSQRRLRSTPATFAGCRRAPCKTYNVQTRILLSKMTLRNVFSGVKMFPMSHSNNNNVNYYYYCNSSSSSSSSSSSTQCLKKAQIYWRMARTNYSVQHLQCQLSLHVVLNTAVLSLFLPFCLCLLTDKFINTLAGNINQTDYVEREDYAK